MLTSSKERFDAIVREAPTHLRHYFTLVTDYRSGKNCKVCLVASLLVYISCLSTHKLS